jgi:hypothetical protein
MPNQVLQHTKIKHANSHPDRIPDPEPLTTRPPKQVVTDATESETIPKQPFSTFNPSHIFKDIKNLASIDADA